jgi:hypothetical protein
MHRTHASSFLLSLQSAAVVLKQLSARFYRIPVFVFSDAVVRIPLAVLDSAIFGTLTYWCGGMGRHAWSFPAVG